ncbi:neural proliferation differentiation and control protein 1 isoform X2 [Anabrus simplex]|uniref:neural proliferation differentiation and control protein 1 isoform X2 n=1 Tax=Anabrus simplex TaxID=316456 RepID=UPI0035A2A623
MKPLLLCLSLSFAVCWGIEARREYFPEVTQEEVMEELERLIQEQQAPERQQALERFSYHFPEYTGEGSRFAVGPSNPRYYKDFNRFGTADQVVPDVFPRDRPSSPSTKEQREFVTNDDEGDDIEEEEEDEGMKPPTPSPSPAPPPEERDEQRSHASLVQVVDRRPVAAEPIDNSDLYFIAIVAGCCAAAVVGIIAIGISWYRLQKSAKAAADVEYPAYGVTGPNKEVSPTGDRRLAQSAQMYHYQHQKQQIIAMESRLPGERNGSLSEAESDEENEEGDYTVYECPGLAPTGEMEVKNPLFQDDPTPATPAPAPKDPANQDRSKP